MPLIRTYRLRRKKPDRRQQLTLVSTVLLTTALLAGTWYFAIGRAPTQRDPTEATWITLEPGSTASQAASSAQPPSSQTPQPSQPPSSRTPHDAQTQSSRTPHDTQTPSSRTLRSSDPGSTSLSATPPSRTETILRCHHPEIGDFYTNAPTCAAANPHNRITIAEPKVTHPAETTYGGHNYTTPEQDAGNSRSD